MNKRKIGKLGEELATCLLEERGYTILERNFSCKAGEVDIICSKKGVLHYVEVKTRFTSAYGRPEEAVDEKKLRHITGAANYYRMTKRPLEDSEEIDVISIKIDHLKGVEI